MRTFRLKVISAMCGVSLLGGCASSSLLGFALSSLSQVAAVASKSTAQDQAARSDKNVSDYAQAIEGYRQTLQENLRNAEIHNGLGIDLARQEKYEEALAEFLKASKLAPLSARIQNNLGYVYLIQGRDAEALATLQIASRLDPASERVRENVKTAEQRLSLVGAAATAPLAGPIVVDRLPQAFGASSDIPRLVNIAPNIYELKQGLPVQLARNVSFPSELGQLEVANGSGVPGLAKKTSSLLRKKGITVAHLTNLSRYNQLVTEIQYRGGQENQAKRINALLLNRAKLVVADRLRPNVNFRLVLGRDLEERPLFEAPTRVAIGY